MSGVFFLRIWGGSAGNDTFSGFDQANPGFTLGSIVETPDFPGADTIIAGAGADSVSAPGGNNHVDGGEGNDTLLGNANSDVLIGGAGSLDRLSGGSGTDVLVETAELGTIDVAALLDGGEGLDTLRLISGGRLVSTQIQGVEVLEAAGGTITISAANFALFDTLRFGTSQSQTDVLIAGLGGTYDFSAISLQTLSGPSLAVARFRGSASEETVIGTERDDVLDGQGGANDVSGGEGNDQLGGSGTVRGGDGDDVVRDFQFEVSADRLEGGDGGDTLSSFHGADTLNGGADDDALQGSRDGADLLLGGDGNDTLTGGAGNASIQHTLRGGEGNDLLVGSGLFGTGGVFDGGAGDDTLEAAGATLAGATYTGIEVLTLSFRTVISAAALDAFDTLDLASNTVLDAFAAGRFDFRDKTLLGNAVFFQGALFAADTILGSVGADTLRGQSGDDSIAGHTGDDVLSGGEGNDRLDGGVGFDIATFFAAVESYTVTALGGGAFIVASGIEGADTLSGIERLQFIGSTLDLGSGIAATRNADNLVGSPVDDPINGLGGNDTLQGLGGADTLLGANGNDLLQGGDDDDRLVGGAGDDTLQGGAGSDRLLGVSGANRLEGGQGGDRLLGGVGNEVLRGDEGDDRLLGGAGADTLTGGTGIDVLAGQGGADTFLFEAPGTGRDRIADFEAGIDMIALSAAGFGLPLGALDPGRFEVTPNGQASAAGPGGLVYMEGTGRLYWDADGAGGAARVEIALVVGAPSLSAADFVVVA